MKEKLIALLRCPVTGNPLQLRHEKYVGEEIDTGELYSTPESPVYPILRGIPRFVPAENYASSFGLQWNRFSNTQLDSHSGTDISRNRFHGYTGWDRLDGCLTLDAGSGSGRFAEIALAAGAEVIAIDFSSAVDACRENLGTHPRLHIVQADIWYLPFAEETFDAIYSLGVLQHTPDVHRSFMSLPKFLKPGARLAVDVYPKLLRNIFWPKYWFRPFTKKMEPATLMKHVERWTKVLLPVSSVVGRIPLLGKKLRFFIPVVNYEGVYPLSEAQLKEFAVLDTFDMFAPSHDHPQTATTLRRCFEEAGLTSIHVERMGFLVGRGVRPGEGSVRKH